MFEPGHTAHPKAGRPAGSETSVKIPKYAARAAIKTLAESAREGNQEAAETLALLMIKGGLNAGS